MQSKNDIKMSNFTMFIKKSYNKKHTYIGIIMDGLFKLPTLREDC